MKTSLSHPFYLLLFLETDFSSSACLQKDVSVIEVRILSFAPVDWIYTVCRIKNKWTRNRGTRMSLAAL